MLIKSGVDISRLNREIRRALIVIETTLRSHDDELVVTSTHEGNHSANSLHYANDALDFNPRRNPKLNIVAQLKRDLGPRFDVVEESDHTHVEYDP